MKLAKRGSVYVADLRRLNIGRVSLKITDKAEAQRKLVELVSSLSRVEAEQQQARASATPTLGAGFRECMAHGSWAVAKDKRSIETRWATVTQFFSPDEPLPDITTRRLKEFKGWMLE